MIAAILTMVAKDLALLWRDRTGMLLIFVLPLVIAAPLATIYSGGVNAVPPLTLQVVDQDDTAASRGLFKALEATGGLKLARASIVVQGEAAVRAGRAAGLLITRLGFEQALNAQGQGGGDFALDQVLEFRADPSRPVELAMLRGLIVDALNAASPTMQVGSAKIAIKSIAGSVVLPRTPYGLSFSAGIVWAAIAAVAVFALSLAREWRGASLLRLRAAPISRAAIVLGKGLACALVMLTAMGIVLVVGIAGFGLRGGAALATGAAGIIVCAVGVMVLLSQFGRSDGATAGVGWTLLLVLALFGGAAMPVHLLPDWMQTIGWVSPVRWFLRLIDGALWRGEGWLDLWRPAAALAGAGLACFIAGVVVLSRRPP